MNNFLKMQKECLIFKGFCDSLGSMEKVEKQEKKEDGVQVYELGYHIVSTVAEENLPKEV